MITNAKENGKWLKNVNIIDFSEESVLLSYRRKEGREKKKVDLYIYVNCYRKREKGKKMDRIVYNFFFFRCEKKNIEIKFVL